MNALVRKLRHMVEDYGLVLLAFLLRHKVVRRAMQAVGRVLGYARPSLGVDVDDGHWNTQTRRHQELVVFIEECSLPRGATILDVGCGPGWLLERLRRMQFSHLHGCDFVAKPAADFPYRQIDLNAEGLKQYEDASFDVAIISDVLEHLENPASMLRDLRRIIGRDGHVFITIPNCWNIVERVNFLFTGNSTRYRSERIAGAHTHISMFTSEVLESLSDRAGLRLVEMRGTYCFAYGHFWGAIRHPLLSYGLMYHFVPTGNRSDAAAVEGAGEGSGTAPAGGVPARTSAGRPRTGAVSR